MPGYALINEVYPTTTRAPAPAPVPVHAPQARPAWDHAFPSFGSAGSDGLANYPAAVTTPAANYTSPQVSWLPASMSGREIDAAYHTVLPKRLAPLPDLRESLRSSCSDILCHVRSCPECLEAIRSMTKTPTAPVPAPTPAPDPPSYFDLVREYFAPVAAVRQSTEPPSFFDQVWSAVWQLLAFLAMAIGSLFMLL